MNVHVRCVVYLFFKDTTVWSLSHLTLFYSGIVLATVEEQFSALFRNATFFILCQTI